MPGLSSLGRSSRWLRSCSLCTRLDLDDLALDLFSLLLNILDLAFLPLTVLFIDRQSVVHNPNLCLCFPKIVGSMNQGLCLQKKKKRREKKKKDRLSE